MVSRVPIDIETSFIGRDMNCLIDMVSGVETVSPYSDVALRVIMRMADLLMFITECPVKDYVDTDDVSELLMEFQEYNYKKRKSIEMDFWVDKPVNYLQALDEDEKEEIYSFHTSFTQSNVVALLSLFLTTKYPINEDYLKCIIDPVFDENQQFIGDTKTKPLKDEMMELRSEHESKFINRYKKDHYSIRRVMLDKERRKAMNKVEMPDEQKSNKSD